VRWGQPWEGVRELRAVVFGGDVVVTVVFVVAVLWVRGSGVVVVAVVVARGMFVVIVVTGVTSAVGLVCGVTVVTFAVIVVIAVGERLWGSP
jgi:hypothetical protein